ncbi:MAG: ABC transporter substrate-binding protein [Bacteroidota bacterium]
MKKYFCIVSIFILLFFYSCDEKQSNDSRTVFKYNEIGNINSLDPVEASSSENSWAINQIFNGLVQIDDSLRIQPCIAKSWEISSDGLSYIFHLRNDVRFHKSRIFKNGVGRIVVAQDFEYSFSRLFDPKISRALSLVEIISHDEKSVKGINAINDTTLIIRLNRPFRPFLNLLSMKFFSVVPHEAIKIFGKDFGKTPIGTGPFKFKKWDDSKMVLLKNEDYFEFIGNKRMPFVDAVNITFIKDKQSAFLQLMRGEIDMISGADAVNIDVLFDNSGKLKDEYKGKFQLQTCPYLKTDYLGFLIDENIPGISNSPVRFRSIRLAMNYAIDRDKMMKFFRNNIGKPANYGFIPPGLPGYRIKNISGYSYRPDKVRQLLREAGYPEGKNLPVITLHTTENYSDLVEFIQSQLEKFNIKINIVVEPARELRKAIIQNEYAFFKRSWVCDYPDAENFLFMFNSKNFSPIGQNYFHFKNGDFDSLYQMAQRESDENKRNEYYSKMDQIIINEAPIIPLFYDQVVRLVSNNTEGLKINALNLPDLKTVKKKKNKSLEN